jgi:hypothetical protein
MSNQSNGTAFEQKNVIASITFDISPNDNMKGGQRKNGELGEKFPTPDATVPIINLSKSVPRRRLIDY